MMKLIFDQDEAAAWQQNDLNEMKPNTYLC